MATVVNSHVNVYLKLLRGLGIVVYAYDSRSLGGGEWVIASSRLMSKTLSQKQKSLECGTSGRDLA
jgi:hypothetical protein